MSSGGVLGWPLVSLGVTLDVIGAHVGSHFDYLGSHWRSLGLMLAHILTLRGLLGIPRTPRTLLWLTFGSILAYPLLGEMSSFSMYPVILVLAILVYPLLFWTDLCVTRLLCGTLWVTCIHFLCIMSLLFFCAILVYPRQTLARRST